MIRLVAASFALVLCVVPLLMAPEKIVGVTGLVGLLLAAVGIAVLWRWPVTAAACAFLVEYALALWVAEASASIAVAPAFGLGILLLLQSADLACRTRHAAVDSAVVRSQIGHWVGLGAGTLAAAMLALAAAHGLAASVPFAATPFLAAAGALGMIVGLAVVIAHAARSASRGAEDHARSR